MRTLTKQILTGLFFLLAVVSTAVAQEVSRDTLRLEVFFRTGVSEVDPSFRENGVRLMQFRDALNTLTASPDAQVNRVVIRSSVSPEGTAAGNARLSDARAQSIRSYLADELGLDPGLFEIVSGGENWEGLAARIMELDVPWKQNALNIIRDKEKTEERKQLLKLLNDGAVWSWLDEHIFPDLRSAGSGIACVIQQPASDTIPVPVIVPIPEPIPVPDPVEVSPDTVYVPQAVAPDTIYVVKEVPVYTNAPKPGLNTEGKRMLLAFRTNILAIPFANVGVEVPLGERWSLGTDLYYPWMWRKAHHEGVDYLGWCYELMALDVEARYWFKPTRRTPETRLTGHSLGLYAAAGQYDFERNWTGHQGEFYNVGVDYLYARPIWGGRMHMEFELGLGYIYSPAQPYDCFVEGGKCFRRRGVKTYVNWFGPTRAQISLVVPIYTRKKGGDR